MLLLEKNKNPEDIIMEKNRKWGYVFDEKLNMYIPDLPRQRKIFKAFGLDADKTYEENLKMVEVK